MLVWFVTFVAARRSEALRLLRPGDDPEASCGPMSLAILARWHGLEPTIDDLNRLARVGDSGVSSMRDLRDAATKIGLHAQAVQLDPTASFPWELPMILHLREDHFAAVLPVGHDRLVLVDPPDEPRLVDRRWLQGDWKGLALVVAKSEAVLTEALGKAGLVKRPSMQGVRQQRDLEAGSHPLTRSKE
ncbi:MAG: cysteine peptidase family C39 domain-containing protein [Isosphaeraceae bacterium]